MGYNISCSIVSYKNERDVLIKAIKCVLNTDLNVKLFLVDNSPTNELSNLFIDDRLDYIHNPGNPGYGTAHNIAIKKAIDLGMKYHLIMNPDITFEKGSLEKLCAFMDKNPNVGSVMPKVFYEDGSLQRLCKLLPTPFDLLGRRFLSNTKWAQKQNSKYELHNFNYNYSLNTPCLSGCFMFASVEVLKVAGFFDERYFMYLEDYDLNRRINSIAKTLFYPGVSITHGHKKESYNNGKLLKIHVLSAIKYFNKWGWIFDPERNQLNKEVLKSIEKLN